MIGRSIWCFGGNAASNVVRTIFTDLIQLSILGQALGFSKRSEDLKQSESKFCSSMAFESAVRSQLHDGGWARKLQPTKSFPNMQIHD
jgi:hypothetical protein